MILVCAATRPELAACARGIAGDRTFATLLTGVGPVHAGRALEAFLARGPRPALVVSSGFAGGIAEALAVGTWVTASSIAGVALRPAPEPAVACAIVSSDALVAGPVDADAVDMESAALANVAARHDVDFMVLRLVSDTAGVPLPGFLAPVTAALAAGDLRSKLAHAARGLRGALSDPRGVARLVADGAALTRELAAGWRRFAPMLKTRGSRSQASR